MLADADMRKRLGRAGVQRARDRFGWDAVAQATLRRYAAVVRRRQSLTGAVAGVRGGR
jgi:glycosyltransferase involved in cell wall biosynthesis